MLWELFVEKGKDHLFVSCLSGGWLNEFLLLTALSGFTQGCMYMSPWKLVKNTDLGPYPRPTHSESPGVEAVYLEIFEF